MRTFPAEEALVVAYWRKLVSSNRVAYKSRTRVSARTTVHGLRTHRRRVSHSDAAQAARPIGFVIDVKRNR